MLVRVVRVADDRHVGPGVDDLLGIDPGDVADDEVWLVDAVARDEMVAREEHFELASKEEIDPYQQDRRHGQDGSTVGG